MDLILNEEGGTRAEDDVTLCSLLPVDGDDSEAIKEELRDVEEIPVEWNVKVNDYIDDEWKLAPILPEPIANPEADDGAQSDPPKTVPTRKSSRISLARQKWIKRYCPNCGKLTNNTSDAQNAIEEKCVNCPNISLIFECVKCHEKNPCYDSISRHVSGNCKPVELLKCRRCAFRTKDREELAQHVKRGHRNKTKKETKCPICGKAFNYPFSLKRHAKIACGFIYPKDYIKCQHCDKKFSSKGYLRAHEEICQDEERFVCDHCGFDTKNKRRLILHMNNRHSLKKRK